MTDNAAVRAIAAQVLADINLAIPTAYAALSYGAQQVIAGRAAAEGVSTEDYYASQVAEYRAEHERAVEATKAADDAAAIAAEVRDHR